MSTLQGISSIEPYLQDRLSWRVELVYSSTLYETTDPLLICNLQVDGTSISKMYSYLCALTHLFCLDRLAAVLSVNQVNLNSVTAARDCDKAQL